jgi:large subunit ribosomal protein L13
MGCEVLKKEDLMAKVEVAAVENKSDKKAYIKKRVVRKFKSFQSKREELSQRWVLVDAKDQVLGRLATQVAHILRGKDLPQYSPHVNMATFIVLINASKIKVTGAKMTDKIYYTHTLFPGGFKETPLKDKLARHPDEVIFVAVKRMLPKNRLAHTLLTQLKIYADDKHPHLAQKPVAIELYKNKK